MWADTHSATAASYIILQCCIINYYIIVRSWTKTWEFRKGKLWKSHTAWTICTRVMYSKVSLVVAFLHVFACDSEIQTNRLEVYVLIFVNTVTAHVTFVIVYPYKRRVGGSLLTENTKTENGRSYSLDTRTYTWSSHLYPRPRACSEYNSSSSPLFYLLI